MSLIPHSSSPKVALLGRPNVGKSTLFNRLIRSNRAITHDRPGITRDRLEGVVRGQGREAFTIIDTGGVTLGGHARVAEGPQELRGFEQAILEQAREAVRESALLCLVVDARDGLTPLDRHLADFLRKSGKPLLLVANKVDGPEKADMLMAEFHALGLDAIPCSAAHGYNVRQLEEEIRVRLWDGEDAISPDALPEILPTEIFPPRLLKEQAEDEAETPESALSPAMPEDETGSESDSDTFAPDTFAVDAPDTFAADVPGPIRLALLGRPNAGKSSLVNALAGAPRMIVSDMAGTTRDSVDVVVEVDGELCVFVDTAGVRRRARISDTVERYSVNSSLKSSTKAHVTLLLLDASEGLTQQDKRLIELLYERKTPFMILVNKWDMVAARDRKTVEKDFHEALAFCRHVPLICISALKRRNLRKIVPLARAVREECSVRISTGRLNRAMEAVLEQHQPPVVKGARAKFFYLTQAESAPPTFVFFVSNADRVPESYTRYLERSLRKIFSIAHAPMRVHLRSSHTKKKQ